MGPFGRYATVLIVTAEGSRNVDVKRSGSIVLVMLCFVYSCFYFHEIVHGFCIILEG